MNFYDRLVELEKLKTTEKSEVARQRGIDFEKLLRDLFHSQGLLSILKTTGYHTIDNKSEQIDGVIKLDGKIFLMEAKWDKKLAASALYEFIGKIENKFYGTLGIFISYHELSNNFINALRKGRKQNVIVLHGDDIKLLFEKKVKISDYLRFSIEKLSFDNISHIPIKEFLEFTETGLKSDIQVDSSSIKKFIKDNILVKKERSAVDMEIDLQQLNDDEKSKLYLILFNRALDFLKFSFPVETSNWNFKTFFSIYKPDFTNPILKTLANKYYSELIFTSPSPYLINFLGDFLEIFNTISKDAKDKFESNLTILYRKVDWEGENMLTHIIKRWRDDISPSVINDVHKIYIDYYFSGREIRFPQKSYANELIKNGILSKDIIFSWLEKKMDDDLKLDDDYTEFNVKYFSKTYFDLALSLKLNAEQWVDEIMKIYKNKCK